MAHQDTLQSEAFWETERPSVIAQYRTSVVRADRESLSRAILALRPRSVLDIGCHCGPLLDRLRRDGYDREYFGVDVNRGAIDEARRVFGDGLFLVSNGRTYLAGTADGLYDVVCCSSLLSHLAPEDARSMLYNMMRVATTAVVMQEPTDRECANIPSWNHDYPTWFRDMHISAVHHPHGVVVLRRPVVDELHEEVAETPQPSDPPLRSKKIAIVGFAPSTRDLAPYDDPSFEIWGQNHYAFHQKRCDRIFELHDWATIARESADGEAGVGPNVRNADGYIERLQDERTRPIYMLAHREDVPRSVAFPIDRVIAHFGESCAKLKTQPYITSSFGHMIGYAILKLLEARKQRWVPEGEELHVYGVDLLSDEEYAYQRSNAEFFGGYCIGAGIKLHIPDQSAIFSNAGIYGYSLGEGAESVSRILHHLLTRRGLLIGELQRFEQQAQHSARSVNAAQSQLNELNKVLTWLETIMRGGSIERPWGN